MMDIHQILKQLPHRYPFLLVDRVLELESGVRIKALKNVTINEPFFAGHFPHRPVMPGVLMLEALAQAAALLAFDKMGITPDDKTHGRPVGLAVDAKGALLIADDVGGTVWRVTGAGG